MTGNVIQNLKLAIELAGDGGPKPFTDEDENKMYELISRLDEISTINPEMLVDSYYPQDIGFMTTAEGQKRYCERKAFIKGIKLCQNHLLKN